MYAATTAPTLKIAPVDRSKLPEMITKVPAAAMIASGTFWLTMLSTLSAEKNDGDAKASTTIRTAMSRSTA
jgi:hypothetical protein